MSPDALRNGLIAALAGGCVFLSVTAITAAAEEPSSQSPASAQAQVAANGCGHSYYRAPNGSCDIVRDPNLDCPDGFHAVAASTPAGYRCVQDGY